MDKNKELLKRATDIVHMFCCLADHDADDGCRFYLALNMAECWELDEFTFWVDKTLELMDRCNKDDIRELLKDFQDLVIAIGALKKLPEALHPIVMQELGVYHEAEVDEESPIDEDQIPLNFAEWPSD